MVKNVAAIIVVKEPRCWHHKFSRFHEQCPNEAVWRSTSPDTGMMVWCDEHPPHPDWRVRL